jgi:hypothetical protein
MEQPTTTYSTNQIRREIELFGKKILIIMEMDGGYSAFVDGKEIDFLSWAIEKQKTLQKESPNE